MLTPRLVSGLRRGGAWDALRRVHDALAPRACATVHAGVTRLPRGLVPSDLALKHRYDYEPVWVSPAAIAYAVPVGNWRGGRSAAGGRFAAPVRWYTHGGGWKSARRHITRSMHGRFVLDGDWEAHLRPFVIRPTVTQLFVDGVDRDATDEYRKLRRRVEEGDLRWTHGCRTVADVERYFDALTASFESIRRTGYRTQEELGVRGGDEIRVCVDRHGRLCVFGGGTHRLSIARILGLERVPVLVKRVHAEWVRSCQALHAGTLEDVIDAGLRQLSGGGASPSVTADLAPRGDGPAC